MKHCDLVCRFSRHSATPLKRVPWHAFAHMPAEATQLLRTKMSTHMSTNVSNNVTTSARPKRQLNACRASDHVVHHKASMHAVSCGRDAHAHNLLHQIAGCKDQHMTRISDIACRTVLIFMFQFIEPAFQCVQNRISSIPSEEQA